MWEDILKNIQISSQRATSRNIVTPNEDEDVPNVEQNDEDCKKWWKDLMKMCNKLLDYVGTSENKRAGYFYNVDYMDNEVLCKAKKSIIEGYGTINTTYAYNSERVKYKDFDVYDPDSDNFLTIYYQQEEIGDRPILRIVLNIEEGNTSRRVYDKSAPILRDHNSTSIFSQSVVDDIGNHIEHEERFHYFILAIDTYYKEWGDDQDFLEKSAIQIGSQRTTSRDLVKPDEDDEDCYQWWLELMSYLNQMISGLDRNATLYQTNEIYSLPPDLVCFYKDALLNIDPYYYKSPYYRGFIRSELDPPVTFTAYFRTDYSGSPPTFYTAISLGDKAIFKHQVKLLNDTFLRDLKTYNTYNKGMAYDFVKKFQDAELKVKEHTKDNSNDSITQHIIEVYDAYFREEFDISKNISIGSQKTTTRKLVGPDDDKSCREEMNELIDSILNYKTDLFEGPPSRSGAYLKSWIGDRDVRFNYESEVRETNSLFLEAHFTRELDEETCCAILMAIDKYKGQDEVETEIPIPSADGYDKGVLVLSKEFTENRMYYHLFMASGKYLAMTISINMRKDGIPDKEWVKVKRIFESR